MYSKTFQTRNSRQNSTPDDLTQPVYIKCHVCCDEFVTFDLAFSRAFNQPAYRKCQRELLGTSSDSSAS